MLDGFFRALRVGSAQAKLVQVLSQHYNLAVSHPSSMDKVRRTADSLGDSFNEHDMAVWFVSDLAKHMALDHPRAVPEVQRYLRVATSAYEHGFAKYHPFYEALCKVASERFGIVPEQNLE